MSDVTHRFFAGKQLVVFGCGYLGGALAREAVRRGIRVNALTRNHRCAEELRVHGVEVTEADLTGSDWHSFMPQAADYAVNTVSSGGGGVEAYRQSYVQGMQSILDWARAARPRTLVYTGSTSVYPQGEGTCVDETCVTGAGDERTALLLEAENLLRQADGIGRWFILRLAGIYGPQRHRLLDQLRAQESLSGSAAHRLNLAHRDDICGAIWAVLTAPEPVANEVFNVADDRPVTKDELVRWLCVRLNLPVPRFDPALSTARRRNVPDRVILNGKLKRLLGWRPVYPDFRAGYEAILATL
jgi:nucleoside-diphosphate-sugar epimerase